jgi:hypothetical protein
VARRGRQPPEEVNRHRTNPPARIAVKHCAHLKPRLLFRAQAVFVSKSSREVIMMFVVPSADSLAITIVKFGVPLAISVIAISAVILREN